VDFVSCFYDGVYRKPVLLCQHNASDAMLCSEVCPRIANFSQVKIEANKSIFLHFRLESIKICFFFFRSLITS
jgi:hypothetical protein